MARKGKQGGKLGTGALPEGELYFFGTEAEQANRVGTGYGDKDPKSNAPHFVQIGTADTGKDLNKPGIDKKSGDFKYSGGV